MHSSMIVGKDCVLVLNFSSTPFYFFEIFSITGQCFETKFQSMLGMSTEEMGELWNESYCENYGNAITIKVPRQDLMYPGWSSMHCVAEDN